MTENVGLPRWAPVALTALGLNSAYLALRHDPTLFYFTNVAGHVALGLLLAATLGPRLRRGFGARAPLTQVALALLGAGTAFGILLLFTGATRPWRWALWTHVVLTALAALALAARVASGALVLPSSPVMRTIGALAVMGSALAPAFRYYADHVAPNGRPIVNPALPPLTMEGEGAGPKSPFFPSSSDTNTGKTIPANFFMTSATCQRCHPDIYDQWNSSAHHFSSFNNQWYRKSIEYMQDVVGTQPSKWCAGCHDHAVFFNGRFDRPIRSRSIPRRPRTASAAPPATPSCTCGAPWGRATSRSSTRRCTTSR